MISDLRSTQFTDHGKCQLNFSKREGGSDQSSTLARMHACYVDDACHGWELWNIFATLQSGMVHLFLLFVKDHI